MRHSLATTLAILSLPFGANLALAKDPVPEGTQATVNISMTVKEKTKGEWSSSAIERVLNAQCLVVAGPATQIASTGPTAEQEAAMADGQTKVQDFQQNYAPSDNMMANMQAMMDKCGEDEACIQAEVMKLSQTAEVQGMVAKKDQAIADSKNLQADLGPVRYQLWHPQSCSGTLSANDTYVTSDPGGEGGDGAYTDTTTVNGKAPVDPKAIVLIMETDSIGNTTSYRLGTPVSATLPSVSSMKGAGQTKVELLGSTKLPETIGPLTGVFGKQSTKVTGPDGAISLTFQGK
jgi:hypothetical protein